MYVDARWMASENNGVLTPSSELLSLSQYYYTRRFLIGYIVAAIVSYPKLVFLARSQSTCAS